MCSWVTLHCSPQLACSCHFPTTCLIHQLQTSRGPGPACLIPGTQHSAVAQQNSPNARITKTPRESCHLKKRAYVQQQSLKTFKKGTLKTPLAAKAICGSFRKTPGLQRLPGRVSVLPVNEAIQTLTETGSWLENKPGFLPLAFRMLRPHNRSFI